MAREIRLIAGGYSLTQEYIYQVWCKTMEYPDRLRRILPVVFRIDSAVCTLDLAGAQASGANIDVAGRTLHDRFDALDIGLPCTIGTTVRVGDLNTKSDALAADFAFCHSWHLLYRLVNKIYCIRNRKKNQVLFSVFFKYVSFHENLQFSASKAVGSANRRAEAERAVHGRGLEIIPDLWYNNKVYAVSVQMKGVI